MNTTILTEIDAFPCFPVTTRPHGSCLMANSGNRETRVPDPTLETLRFPDQFQGVRSCQSLGGVIRMYSPGSCSLILSLDRTDPDHRSGCSSFMIRSCFLVDIRCATARWTRFLSYAVKKTPSNGISPCIIRTTQNWETCPQKQPSNSRPYLPEYEQSPSSDATVGVHKGPLMFALSGAFYLDAKHDS